MSALTVDERSVFRKLHKLFETASVGRSGRWGCVELPFLRMGPNYASNQVIRLAFTFDPMKFGKYGVLSGSRVFTFLANMSYPLGSVTISPVSVAAQGLVSEDKGLSLRFPRFVRVREDKSVEQASSAEFLVGMYRGQQEQGKDLGGADDGHLIDQALSENAMDDDWEDEFD
jgi:hypothetical protein